METAVIAYVSDCTDKFYISRQVMRELGIIPPDFPKITIPIQTAAAGSTGSDLHLVDAQSELNRPRDLMFSRFLLLRRMCQKCKDGWKKGIKVQPSTHVLTNHRP